jgi:hypothetical protein
MDLTKEQRDELFRRHPEEPRERSLQLTPLQRLLWLEDTQEFALRNMSDAKSLKSRARLWFIACMSPRHVKICSAAFIVVALCVRHPLAQACSSVFGGPGTASFPRALGGTPPPVNTLHTTGCDWRRGGSPQPLVSDPVWTSRLGLPVRRFADAGSLVGVTVSSGDSNSYCGSAMTMGPEDMIPPAAPRLAVEVHWQSDPQGAGCYSCGDKDELRLDVVGNDDRSPHYQMQIGVYIGTTEQETRAKADADDYMGFDENFRYDESLVTTTSSVVLGSGVSHARGTSPLSFEGKRCVAVTLVDWAGNESGKSNVVCFSSTEPASPVLVRDGSSSGCRTGASQGNWAATLLAALIFSGVLWRRRSESRQLHPRRR